MIIRKTRKNDLSRIMEIYQDPTSYEPYIAKVYLEKEPDFGIVAEINGTIVGYIRIHPHYDSAWLGGLYVHSEYRGRRIGRTLLQEAFTRIKSLGGKVTYIDVHLDNVSAIRLYEKLGFKIMYVRSHLTATVEAISSKIRPANWNFHDIGEKKTSWDIITNSKAYLARSGIIMGSHIGWTLRKGDLENFKIHSSSGKSIILFREVVDLMLVPNIHGVFEKRYSDSKHARTSCTRFEVNFLAGNYINSKKLLSHVTRRARRERANLIDIWTWREDPLFGLYTELCFENWGNLYLMRREL